MGILHPAPLRPLPRAYGNTPGMTHGDVALRPGWNEVLFKFVRDAEARPFLAHVMFTGEDPWDILNDLVRTRFPWEA